ncbi:hypothetical protein [Pontibacter sp. SGAir0037]|uniref:hypothetical protein n=1 Tax=Pontibacter sp. SGAir0037 TaxID=2571030 RepID=UPI0010F8D89A|nr:hypothetical protein [Pontibacter sp. SGAir0037]
MKKTQNTIIATTFMSLCLLFASSCDSNPNNAGNTTGVAPEETRRTGVDGSGDLPGTGREDTAGIIQTEADTVTKGHTTGNPTGN